MHTPCLLLSIVDRQSSISVAPTTPSNVLAAAEDEVPEGEWLCWGCAQAAKRTFHPTKPFVPWRKDHVFVASDDFCEVFYRCRLEGDLGDRVKLSFWNFKVCRTPYCTGHFCQASLSFSCLSLGWCLYSYFVPYHFWSIRKDQSQIAGEMETDDAARLLMDTEHLSLLLFKFLTRDCRTKQ